MPTIIHETVIQLVKFGVGSSNDIIIPIVIDWEQVLNLAIQQGVCGICLEGIEKLPSGVIPQDLLLQWIGQTEIERLKYQHVWKVACKLDKLWAVDGIHAIVLKGRSIAQYYPVPHHRYSCDLDVFIGEGWGRACELLENQGVQLGCEVYKEVEFTLDNVYVECHRYITPLRGNKQLTAFERYLRSLLDSEHKEFFEGTTLIRPPLMFTVLLYIEHALGDFLHGHLLLKHIVDWVILRRQKINRDVLITRCKEFKFDRFLSLIDSLADVVEGKIEYNELLPIYRDSFDAMFMMPNSSKPRSWLLRRMNLFFDIIKNGKRFRNYGYISMPAFLFNSVWAHFFEKEVRL